jgi:hypothetical protein
MRLSSGIGMPGGRDLNLYWWGQTTSAFGSVFTAIAMPVIAVIHLDASAGEVSLITAASILPLLLFGLPAGALADRVARPRRMLILLDAFSALAVGAVAVGVGGRVASLVWLIALAGVQGCVTILLELVYFIHLRQLTDAANLGPARARLQAGEYAAGFVGRLLVGPTIVVLGAGPALAVDAVSYLLSALALLGMRSASLRSTKPAGEADRVSLLRGMGAGFRFFAGGVFQRALLVTIVVPVAAKAGVTTLTALFLLRVVKVPTELYGMFFAISGLMGLTGSLLAGRLLRPSSDARQVMLGAFLASVVCSLLLPLAGGPLPVAVLCAALGLSLPILFGAIANVALTPVIVADVPENAMGATVATLQVVGAAAGLVGALLGGVLGDWIGVRAAIWALDLGALAAVLLFVPRALRVARRLRQASAVKATQLVDATGR